jgi:hypothetical protein
MALNPSRGYAHPLFARSRCTALPQCFGDLGWRLSINSNFVFALASGNAFSVLASELSLINPNFTPIWGRAGWLTAVATGVL